MPVCVSLRASHFKQSVRKSGPRMVRIQQILPGTIADELSLEIGSRVVRINGEPVRDSIEDAGDKLKKGAGDAKDAEKLGDRLKILLEADDKAANLIKALTYQGFQYASSIIPEVADTVKPTSAEAIASLKALGLRPVLLPGPPFTYSTNGGCSFRHGGAAFFIGRAHRRSPSLTPQRVDGLHASRHHRQRAKHFLRSCGPSGAER